ncbi:MAG: hypothetical protein V3T77_08610 [Planctomycetota bacterium]
MVKFKVLLFIAALIFGIAIQLFIRPWAEALPFGQELELAKEELLNSAGLMEAHNLVYQEVGEKAWENSVKPAFLRVLVLRTVVDTWNLFPTWRDVVAWVRAHPQEANEILAQEKRRVSGRRSIPFLATAPSMFGD